MLIHKTSFLIENYLFVFTFKRKETFYLTDTSLETDSPRSNWKNISRHSYDSIVSLRSDARDTASSVTVGVRYDEEIPTSGILNQANNGHSVKQKSINSDSLFGSGNQDENGYLDGNEADDETQQNSFVQDLVENADERFQNERVEVIAVRNNGNAEKTKEVDVRENLNGVNRDVEEDAVVLVEDEITGVNEQSNQNDMGHVENEREREVTERKDESEEIVDEIEVDAEKYIEENTSTIEKVNEDDGNEEKSSKKCSFIRDYVAENIRMLSDMGKDGTRKKYDIAMKQESNNEVQIECVKEIGVTTRSVVSDMANFAERVAVQCFRA